MWDLPRPGLEPVSPALAGRFSTTAPPRKPEAINFFHMVLESIDIYKSMKEEVRLSALLVINVRLKYMAQMHTKWTL